MCKNASWCQGRALGTGPDCGIVADFHKAVVRRVRPNTDLVRRLGPDTDVVEIAAGAPSLASQEGQKTPDGHMAGLRVSFAE